MQMLKGKDADKKKRNQRNHQNNTTMKKMKKIEKKIANFADTLRIRQTFRFVFLLPYLMQFKWWTRVSFLFFFLPSSMSFQKLVQTNFPILVQKLTEREEGVYMRSMFRLDFLSVSIWCCSCKQLFSFCFDWNFIHN